MPPPKRGFCLNWQGPGQDKSAVLALNLSLYIFACRPLTRDGSYPRKQRFPDTLLIGSRILTGGRHGVTAIHFNFLEQPAFLESGFGATRHIAEVNRQSMICADIVL